MAEEKKKVPFGERTARFFRDYKSEFKKMVWPTWKDTAKLSEVVIAAIAIVSAGIGVCDWLFNQGLTLLAGLI